MKNLCCRRSWKNVLINRIENDYFFKKYLFIIIISLIFIKFLLKKMGAANFIFLVNYYKLYFSIKIIFLLKVLLKKEN